MSLEDRFCAVDDADLSDSFILEDAEIAESLAVTTVRRKKPLPGVSSRWLFLHGAGGRAFQFRFLMRNLLQTHTNVCFALDWPSHGRAPVSSVWGAHAALKLTDLVVRFLERYARDGDVLVAHSYGCAIALRALSHMAADAPRLKGIVLLTPNVDAKMAKSPVLYYGTWLLPLVRPLVSRGFNARCFHALTSAELIAEETRQSKRNAMRTMADLGYHMEASHQFELAVAVAKSETGVLVVTGIADGIVPKEEISAFYDNARGVTMREMTKSGHLPQIEEPDTLCEVILEHLGGGASASSD